MGRAGHRGMKGRLAPCAAILLLAAIARSQAPMAAAGAGAEIDIGAKLYAARCATCHGDALNGGDHGPELKGKGFWAEWQGAPARRLYSRILSTMPMNDPGSLSPAETLSLVAFVTHANGHPLPPVKTADDLNAIVLPAGTP